MDRAVADYIGMLATVMNALCLQEAIEKRGVDSRLMTGIEMRDLAEPFILRRAIRHLEQRRVVLFAAGTGSPFFTTDTAAALRGLEIKAEALLKATNVEGVYDGDPQRNTRARLLRHVTFNSALKRELRVMDSTAFSLSKDHNLPIIVFNIRDDPSNIRRVVFGEALGTLVSRSLPTSPKAQAKSTPR